MILRRTVLVLAGCCSLVVGNADAAAAHAVLVETSPPDGAQLSEAPSEVRLVFNEGVSAPLGSVRIFDGEGERVDTGSLVLENTTVTARLVDDLGEGAYVVTYRVVSADAHPIRGAFSFTVGDAAPAEDDVIAQLLGEGDEQPWEVGGFLARSLAYGGVLLAAGLGLFLVLAHDGGPEAPRLRRWLVVAAGAGAAGVVLAIPLQAAVNSGLGIDAVLEDGVLDQVLGDGVGLSTAVVLAGLAVLVVDRGRRTWSTALGAVAATTGFVIAGHTATSDPRWLISGADALHVIAAAVWLGGLVGLALTLVMRREDIGGAAPVVARFSGIAALALAAVAVGGSIQAWYEVRALDALTSTTYGWTLVAKVAVVAVVAALGGWNRFRLLPALASAPRRASELLRRTVRIESGLLLAAVGITAVLVNVTPARTEAGIGTIFSETVALGDGSVNIVVDPNRRGFNQIHLYVYDRTGRIVDSFEDVTLELSLPSAEVGPLVRDPFVAGPGHYQLDGSDLSIAGTWTVEVIGRVSQFDQVTATVEVPVNP